MYFQLQNPLMTQNNLKPYANLKTVVAKIVYVIPGCTSKAWQFKELQAIRQRW